MRARDKNRIRKTRRPWVKLTAVLAAVAAVWVVGVPRSRGDDRDLLRENTAEPFLFILLDSSLSMGLSIDGNWVEANADDPRSRLYQAKEALYTVLSNVSGVRFGFATFNHDGLSVVGKHFLYFVEDEEENQDAITALGLSYPAIEPDNEVEVPITAPDGFPDIDIQIDGDMLTFGAPPTDPGGTCTSPLALNTAREKINRYPKLGIDGSSQTDIFVSKAGSTYRLRWDLAGGTFGDSEITVTLTVDEVTGCSADVVTATVLVDQKVLKLKKWREFLMTDDGSGSVTYVGVGNDKKGNSEDAVEDTGGYWSLRDADGGFKCGDAKPFSGGGWEGNYDTGTPFSNSPGLTGPLQNDLEPNVTPSSSSLFDTYCTDSARTDCALANYPTTIVDATYRALDFGDVLPFSLDDNNKDSLLQRLNPNHGRGLPADFGISSYFQDTPDATLGRLKLKSTYTDNPPIVAAGVSPISDAILDFRCWYTNSVRDSGGKCGRSNLADVYTTGFMEAMQALDPAVFNCRQPYLIVISDLYTNCPGNSSVAQVAGMNSQTKSGGNQNTGVSTWVLNMSGSKTGNPLTNAGKGEEIEVDSKLRLRQVLDEIIGLIKEQSSSFASAAVPSVQADVDDKIYITQFVPRKESTRWEGHVFGFVKPVQFAIDPVTGNTVPDPTTAVWDGGEVLKTQAPSGPLDVSDPTTVTQSTFRVGGTDTDRRLYYPMAPVYYDRRAGYDSDKDGNPANDREDLIVPRVLLPLALPESGSTLFPFPSGVTEPQALADLLIGMGLASWSDFSVADFVDKNTMMANHPVLVQRALKVFRFLYEINVVQPTIDGVPSTDPADAVEYVLGDVFHATPKLVGGPRIGRYVNLVDDFPEYRSFFRAQERRRKVLLVASDDGQLHSFDAGRFGWDDPDLPVDFDGQPDDPRYKFSNGVGRELFSFIPRQLLPTVTLQGLNEGVLNDHTWALDGTPAASDVFIDPMHSGRHSASDPPKADERSWRTVVIGGMRRGGTSYYALDVTRPDVMHKYMPQIDSNRIDDGWSPVQVNASGDDMDEIDTQHPAMYNCFGSTNTQATFPAGFTDDAEDDADLKYAHCGDGIHTAPVLDGSGNPVLDAGGNPVIEPLVRYPMLLWEFTDPDLGQTWSVPDMGAIKVCIDTDGICDPGDPVETRYVTIFGGGWDPAGFSSTASTGDYLYMVDIETGELIYKRFLDHSASPGAPAAVDTNQDGFLDRIYIATTGNTTAATATSIAESKSGKVYRVDLKTPVPIVEGTDCDPANLPVLPWPSSDACCAQKDGCIIDPAWEPYAIFDSISTSGRAGGAVNGAPTLVVPGTDRHIFFDPSVIFSSQLGRYAVAFGTGNRENLWSTEPAGPDGIFDPTAEEDGNRIYLFVDDSDLLGSPGEANQLKDELPRVESDFVDVTDPDNPVRASDLATILASSDLQAQANGYRGWYIRLGVVSLTFEDAVLNPANEKAIGPVTALSGINIASTFIPTVGDTSAGTLCARRGYSRSYVQFTSDGRPVIIPPSGTTSPDPSLPPPPPPPPPPAGADSRSTEAANTLLSEPFIEQGGPCEGGEAMRQVLMDEIFPPNCSFASYYWNLSSMRADTGVECLAQIPVCITEKNWKDE